MPVVLKPARRKLTAIIEPAEGVYVAFCPELDLATEGGTPDSAVDDLIEMALDYTELVRSRKHETWETAVDLSHGGSRGGEALGVGAPPLHGDISGRVPYDITEGSRTG